MRTSIGPAVCVAIVTRNEERFIRACLDSVFAQTYRPAEVIIVDNGSVDSTLAIVESYGRRVSVIRNTYNTGYAVPNNQAIRRSRADWVLTLNADAILHPECLAEMIAGTEIDPRVGTICGKLFRLLPDLTKPAEPILDSTGIFFTPTLRHFDRGSGELDGPQFQRTEYVFGATAACALYKREMIDDISFDGGFFDPDFFAYREDADVAWRAQLLGWRCLYLPQAIGHHVRRVLPSHRNRVPAVFNMHSVKNRFLMRIKNITPRIYAEHWLAMTGRDLLIAAACVLTEQSSLPAFWQVLKQWPRTLEKRRRIMSHRKVSEEYMASWFASEPVSYPVPAPIYASEGVTADRAFAIAPLRY